MGLRHRTLPIHGIQYHPESIMTTNGKQQLANFLKIVETHKRKGA
jgi:anthranilate/para-aminobenzoate synthase component II